MNKPAAAQTTIRLNKTLSVRHDGGFNWLLRRKTLGFNRRSKKQVQVCKETYYTSLQAALCAALDADLQTLGETGLSDILERIDQFELDTVLALERYAERKSG